MGTSDDVNAKRSSPIVGVIQFHFLNGPFVGHTTSWQPPLPEEPEAFRTEPDRGQILWMYSKHGTPGTSFELHGMFSVHEPIERFPERPTLTVIDRKVLEDGLVITLGYSELAAPPPPPCVAYAWQEADDWLYADRQDQAPITARPAAVRYIVLGEYLRIDCGDAPPILAHARRWPPAGVYRHIGIESARTGW